MNKQVLAAVWKEVEVAYQEERINSERALQAVMYRAMSDILPEHYLVLVEPGWAGYCPDLVVIDREAERLVWIVELKCAPHWWHSEKDVSYDFAKLLTYSQLNGSVVEYDVFGPDRVFDEKDSKWLDGRRTCVVDGEVLYVFGDIARKETSILQRAKIAHAIARHPNFVLLAGSTDPSSRTAVFTVT